MRLPELSHAPKVIERVLCGSKGVLAGDREGGEVIFAENMDLAAMPTLRPRTARTRLGSIPGDVLQFFCNGECVVLITRTEGAYAAVIWLPKAEQTVAIELPEPREDAFLYAHAWRKGCLYLPAFNCFIDTELCLLYRTDHPLSGGDALIEHDEELIALQRHIVYFKSEHLNEYRVGDRVKIEYNYFEKLDRITAFLRIVAIDPESGAVTLEGEGAIKLIYAETESVSMCYDVPIMNGIFGDPERLYGFCRNKIYVSAKDSSLVRFTPLDGSDTQLDARELDLSAEITGGCMYRGRPIFFTDGAAITLEEDSELGLRVSIIPTVGVTPRAVTSPAAIGGKVCYFSRYGLTVFDGKQGRVVRTGLGVPARGGAVADGRFYSFVATREGEEPALYAYDAEGDLLYCLGDATESDISFALGGVLVGSAANGEGGSDLILFADGESLPYPITDMVESGVLSLREGLPFESSITLGEVRNPDGSFGPFSLVLDASLGEGGSIELSLFYEGEEQPARSFSLAGKQARRRFSFPLYPRRCRGYHVRLCGKGEFAVFGLSAMRRA